MKIYSMLMLDHKMLKWQPATILDLREPSQSIERTIYQLLNSVFQSRQINIRLFREFPQSPKHVLSTTRSSTITIPIISTITVSTMISFSTTITTPSELKKKKYIKLKNSKAICWNNFRAVNMNQIKCFVGSPLFLLGEEIEDKK